MQSAVSISLALLLFIISWFQSCDCQMKVCITGETAHSFQLNGEYAYHSYDSTANGNRYYNSATGYYLYPYKSATPTFEWLIHADYTQTTWWYAKATVSPTPSPTYVFDIDDVFREWRISVGGGGWIWHRVMLAVECTSVCASGGLFSKLTGRYVWDSFSTTKKCIHVLLRRMRRQQWRLSLWLDFLRGSLLVYTLWNR
eukprot:407067_1